MGVAVAGYYAISAWSQVLIWPASQAPFYQVGWQSALALLVVVIGMTGLLRCIDVRYLLPKRLAFRAELERDAEEHDSGDQDRGDSRDVDWTVKTRVVDRALA